MEEQKATEQEAVVSEKPKRKKRPQFMTVLLVIVLVLVAVFALMWLNDDSDEYPEKLVGGTVSVLDESFQPETISIKKGESVTWVNNSDNNHMIASDPHPQHETLPGLYSPEQLKPGDAYTYTFSESGTYTYHDELNPLRVKGTVIVE